ncbi:hypothetical protein ACFOSC_19585 [Streptantibioticus rubrisoli]|uniref:DUF2335 domain-containing protein n=1 Tax=Streptantibioticus rubrisoli TaxID=1387313 RepID=A0ABT1PK89_9ACTN|nr:hypothetical protein [Streptantibioticus rubrisoli]MCQ4045771.1 hypothetical protein [Streptantibioticus rubrisoli]
MAVITGVFTMRWRRRSDKIMARLTAEIETLGKIPDDLIANQLMSERLDASAQKYAEACAFEDTLHREPASIVLGILLAVGGIGLGLWNGAHKDSSTWWLIVALFMAVMGIFGATYEAAGGKSRDAARSTSGGTGQATQ